MTQEAMLLKLQILEAISRATGLVDSPDRTKLLAAMWVLHDTTPTPNSGPGEER